MAILIAYQQLQHYSEKYLSFSSRLEESCRLYSGIVKYALYNGCSRDATRTHVKSKCLYRENR